jgi:hypothetical protein
MFVMILLLKTGKKPNYNEAFEMGKFGNTRIDLSSFNYRVTDITSAFEKWLNRYRLSVSEIGVYTDPEDGVTFARLADSAGDDVEFLFNVDEVGTAGCSILNNLDEENGWIDLEGILPVEDGKLVISDFYWLRKTVLKSIMAVGQVDFSQEIKESSQAGHLEYLIDEAYATRGDKLVTIVTHRKRMRKLSQKNLIVIGASRRLHHLKKFQAA